MRVIKDVFSLEVDTKILSNESSIVSYPHLLKFFDSKERIEESDVVCGIHMAYGWMPTIVEIHRKDKNSLCLAADILTKAKNGEEITKQELEDLAKIINNSYVGASKVLHFVSPSLYPIWDSKIYKFLYGETPHHSRVNRVEKYLIYIEYLKELVNDKRFKGFYESVCDKLEYKVTPIRALELVMFVNSPKKIQYSNKSIKLTAEKIKASVQLGFNLLYFKITEIIVNIFKGNNI